MVARDGESALALLEEIDVVLMDAVMPGLDGFETCHRIKQEPHSSHLPVIFMTGLSETGHVVQGLAAGGVDYELLDALDALVSAELLGLFQFASQPEFL